MESKYIALYCRTSTNLQATGLESQVHALKTYCEAKRITNVRVYSDAGVSGAKSSRPGLDQLLADVKAGHITQVITYSLSRLSRSTSHLLQTLELLKSLSVGFVSLSEAIDLATPMGIMVVTVLGAVAQLEREITVERVRTGLRNAVAKGKPLGRKRTRNSELIQSLHAKGFSYRAIAKMAKCAVSTVGEELKLARCPEIVVTGQAKATG